MALKTIRSGVLLCASVLTEIETASGLVNDNVLHASGLIVKVIGSLTGIL